MDNLHLICSPWSTSEYTNNWRYLFHIGRSKITDQSSSITVPAEIPWIGMLKRSLLYLAERRLDITQDEGYIRPMSMKMCPPNYLLKGLNVVRDSEGLAKGIHSIICVPGNPDPLLRPYWPSEVEVEFRLSYSYSEEEYELFDSYKMSGAPFSLNQQIGTTFKYLASDQIVPLKCTQEDYVIGSLIFLGMEDDLRNPIKDFSIGCVKKPQIF